MIRRLTAICLLCLFVIPVDAHALTLRQRAQQRREARLIKQQKRSIRRTTTEVNYRGRRVTRNALRRRRRLRTQQSKIIREKKKTTEQKMEERVLALVNEERKKAGVSLLRYNDLLRKAALAHAKDMYTRNYFAHESPEGKTAKNRIQQTGYLNITFASCRCTSWSYVVGENIAKGQETAEKVMSDWMDSPGHKENILSPDFAETGIALFNNVWAQNFGRITTK